MKKNKDKLLVIVTSAIALWIGTIIFFENFVSPKHLKIQNALTFGEEKSSVQFILFEDFQCKFCKKYTNEIFPEIKEKYLDTNKICYKIIPLAFMNGSKPIANAAIAIYELNKEKFFEFIKIISEKRTAMFTKQDLIEIVKNLDGIDLKAFIEFLNQEPFNEYLKKNLDYAKNIMKSKFHVPAMYLNGTKVNVKELKVKIEELFISYDKSY